MAKTKISEFSATPANNTDIDSINIAEGCAPSGINDAIRELMAQLKDFQTGAVGDSFNGPIGTSTAAAGAFTTLSASSTATLSGLTASTALALDASKNIVSVTNTGTGSNVLATSPTLVTPILGTPTSATLTNATGLPIATGVSGLGTGVATFLATPSSANLAAALTDETGSGANVFATSPTLVTPILGTPTSATLTNATGLPLTTGVTGTLPTANGGTGLTSFTSGGVVYASSSSALATGSALTFDGTTLAIGGTSTASPFFATKYQGLVATLDRVGDYGQSLQLIRFGIAGNAGIGLAEQNALGFYLNTTEYARLTTTGLGIGTSSPAEKLDVQSSANGIGSFASTSTGYGGIYVGNSSRRYSMLVRPDTSNSLVFGDVTAGANRLILDNSGNLGLGVTPSAWQSSLTPIQGLGYSLYSATATQVRLSANEYFNAGSIYRSTGVATLYQQSSGQHQFFTAASGTAGNAISFTQAMTLDASGNLGVGTTSPQQNLDIRGSTTVGTKIFGVGTNANAVTLLVNSAGNQSGSYNADTASVQGVLCIGAYTSGATATSLVARGSAIIAETVGNLLVGTTSSLGTYKFQSEATGSNQAAILRTDTTAQACVDIWNQGTTGDNQFENFFTEGGSGTLRGSIRYNRAGGLVSYNVTSDYRAKNISGPVTGSGALIDSIPVYMGTMKGATQERPMFIAHETPSYAHTGEKDAVDADGNPVYQQMDASALIPVMWAEIQSLRKRLADAGI